MTDVKATDPATVVVTFKRPQAFDPGLAIPILPKHIWTGMSSAEIQKFANDTPVGTGPFTFGSWKRGQTISVDRNPDFWGTAGGCVERDLGPVSERGRHGAGLKTGDVDILPEVPPTIWDGLGSGGTSSRSRCRAFSFHHIGINVSGSSTSGGNPLLLDRDVRQALSLAVDRNQLVQIALAGHGKPGSVIFRRRMGDFQLRSRPTRS